MRKFVLFLLSLAAITAAPAQPKPVNVLFICVDDLKPLTHAYGDAHAITPHLDRLANRGVRFDLAYCNQAVCAPSRFNLLVGSRSTTLGIYGFGRSFRTVFPDAVTMPQYFKQHGYTSASIGKVFHIGHGLEDDEPSWSRPAIHGKVIEYLLPESTEGDKLTREEALFGNIHSAVPHNQLARGSAWECVDVPDNAYSDGRTATEAVRALAEFKRTGEKFFLAVGFSRPHLPFVPPKKYWDLYDPAKLPLAANPLPPQGAPEYALKRLLELNQFSQVPGRQPLTEELQRKLIHGYYASVSYADAQIGRVLKSLEEEGLAGNTVVVLWGDHGYSLGTHGDWTKHSNYEQATRIPVIFAGPGIARGLPTSAMFETVDFYPTLAALASLPAPTGPQPLDGKSQVAVLQDPAHASVRDHVYHAYPRNRPQFGGEWLGSAIRTPRHRLVVWQAFNRPEQKPDIELYDYSADPLESRNIASERPEIVAELRALLAREPAPRAPRRE